MNTQLAQGSNITFAFGDAFGGGFYAGIINVGGDHFVLVVSPKADGNHDDVQWNDTYKSIDGALSFNDGLANTEAMATAGSKVAKWARGLRINGHDDWYLASQDELEICYRNIKPTDKTSSPWNRSGVNINSVPPTAPYSVVPPSQTTCDQFKERGDQCFESDSYWTSTQHADGSDYAWSQSFDYGTQVNWRKDNKLRVRAVRRIKI